MNWKCCTLVAIGLLASRPAAAEDRCELAGYAELPVTMAGHRADVTGTIDGQPVTFLFGSSTFNSKLKAESAQRLGLHLHTAPFAMRLRDATGSMFRPRIAVAEHFSLVGFSRGQIFNDVKFIVFGGTNILPEDGTIGPDVIGRGDAEYDLANGVIRLFTSEHCNGQVLAYWHGSAPVAQLDIEEVTPWTPGIVATVVLNGRSIRAVFDSSADRSILTQRAAARAGVRPDDQGIVALGKIGGYGNRMREFWIGRFDTLDLGGEIIRNARLGISDVKLPGDADLVLGADFFLSHRIYVAPKRRLVWFTYNGGPVFDLKVDAGTKTAGVGSSTPATKSTPSSGPASDTPVDAAGFRRRGAASAGRLQYAAAIADFDRAIALAPSDPQNYYQRGMAYWSSGKLEPALGDFDQALKLKEDNVSALVARGGARLQNHDVVGAREDFAKVRSLAPNDLAVQLQVSGYLMNSRDFADAIAWLNSALAADLTGTTRASVLNDRCWARAMLNQDLDQALADCNSALRITPNDSNILDSRGLVYLRKGEFGNAIDDYQRALRQAPQDYWVRYGLGLAELKKGLQIDGKSDIKQAIAGDPDVGERYKRIGLSPPSG